MDVSLKNKYQHYYLSWCNIRRFSGNLRQKIIFKPWGYYNFMVYFIENTHSNGIIIVVLIFPNG